MASTVGKLLKNRAKKEDRKGSKTGVLMDMDGHDHVRGKEDFGMDGL